MKAGRDNEKRISFGWIKEKDRDSNLDIYGEMVPSIYSWMNPSGERRKIKEMNNMMAKRDSNDGKATDVDMGFRNNGLK